LRSLQKKIKSKSLLDIRGLGLFLAVELKHDTSSKGAWDFTIQLAKEYKILVKPTQNYTIRLTPTLIIDKEDCDYISDSFAKVLND